MALLDSICRCGQRRSACECSAVYESEKFFRGSATDRGYDTAWRKTSLAYRRDFPLCEHCLAEGRTTPVDDVHHIAPIRLRPDLRLDRGNLVSLCRQCHKIADGLIVKEEKQRAKRPENTA